MIFVEGFDLKIFELLKTKSLTECLKRILLSNNSSREFLFSDSSELQLYFIFEFLMEFKARIMLNTNKNKIK